MSLLAGAFQDMPPALALSILDPKINFTDAETQRAVNQGVQVLRPDGSPFTAYDVKRLQVSDRQRVAEGWLSVALCGFGGCLRQLS